MRLNLNKEFKYKINRYFGADDFTSELFEAMVGGLRASPKWINDDQLEQLKELGFEVFIDDCPANGSI